MLCRVVGIIYFLEEDCLLYEDGRKFSFSRKAFQYKIDSFNPMLSNQLLIEFFSEGL